MMVVFFLVAIVALVTLTLLPLWRNDAWWVRAQEFPRLQLSMIALIANAAPDSRWHQVQ